MLWCVVIVVTIIFAQQFILGMYVGTYHPEYLQKFNNSYPVVNIGRLQRDFQYDGTFFSLTTIILFTVTIVMLLAIVKLKKKASYIDYFAIRLPDFASIQFWAFVLFLVLFAANAYALVIGKPVPPEFLKKLYISADPTWLLFMSIIVLNPLFNELLFRGFVLSGLENSELTPVGAVIVTSFIWALVHYQLDLYMVVITFALGIVFGFSRIYSRSILLPIGLHMFMNSAALLVVINSQS